MAKKRTIEISMEQIIEPNVGENGVVVVRKKKGEIFVVGDELELKDFVKKNCTYCQGEGITNVLLTPVTRNLFCFACLPEGARVVNKHCAGN